MAIKSSGSLALTEIAAEFGSSAPYSISQFYRGGGKVPDVSQNNAVPSSGTISFGNFYSAVNQWTTYWTTSWDTSQTTSQSTTTSWSTAWTTSWTSYWTVTEGPYYIINATDPTGWPIQGRLWMDSHGPGEWNSSFIYWDGLFNYYDAVRALRVGSYVQSYSTGGYTYYRGSYVNQMIQYSMDCNTYYIYRTYGASGAASRTTSQTTSQSTTTSWSTAWTTSTTTSKLTP